jgi:hypothetical protein
VRLSARPRDGRRPQPLAAPARGCPARRATAPAVRVRRSDPAGPLRSGGTHGAQPGGGSPGRTGAHLHRVAGRRRSHLRHQFLPRGVRARLVGPGRRQVPAARDHADRGRVAGPARRGAGALPSRRRGGGGARTRTAPWATAAGPRPVS